MARAISFVVGELARRATLAGSDVTVRMVAQKITRARSEAKGSLR